MEKFINIHEASEFLGVKEMTIYGWRHEGRIPNYKIHGKLMFRLSELNKFAEAFKQPMLRSK